MIKKVKFMNYKAFECGEIPIKPITILLGANSVGKSSIIQLLLLLQQTGKEDLKSYKSALKLYGGYVNLGDARNLFRKRDTSKPVELKFEMKSKELKDYLKDVLLEDYIDGFTSITKYLPIKGLLELRNKELKTKSDYEYYINSFIDLISKLKTQKEYLAEVSWFLSQRSPIKLNDITKENKSVLLKIYDFLFKLAQGIKDEMFEISFVISFNKGKLFTQSVSIVHNGIIIVEYDLSKDTVFKSSLASISNEQSEELIKLLDGNNTIFNLFQKNISHSHTTALSIIIYNIFQFSISKLREEFANERINYVSPLRAHPKRYYMLDKAKVNLTLDTLDGDAIADVLKDNSNLKGRVNKWLEKFNLSVNVEEFKEVVHHLKVKQNNLDLDITDVGFGISQVLPVIIQGFLSSNNSTTIIEQPEIHLHPKMQADLADLFIDIVNANKKKKLIIETHSEYILKRLRRRISEGLISSDDVSICLFHPLNKDVNPYIENLEIEKKGFFDWPIDFYGGELLKDTTEFLKNQQ
jgi:hypothetical protein